MQALGKTTSGKIIFGTQDVLKSGNLVFRLFWEFSAPELFEAYCVFEYLAARAKTVTFEMEWSMAFGAFSAGIKDTLLSTKAFERLKINYQLLNSYQMIIFGKTLAEKEFQS